MTALIAQPFLDWYGIWPGQAGCDDHGRSWFEDPPHGVCLRVQPARSLPFFRRERLWEQHRLHHLILLIDDDRYRMWYNASASDEPADSFTCYAESGDGFQWERPELGRYVFRGSRANNIVADPSFFGFHSVFIDPRAPTHERYKAIDAVAQLYRHGRPVANTRQNKEEIREVRRAMELEGQAPDAIDAEAEIRHVLRGAVSPDGLRWQVLDAPLFDAGKTQLDTQNIAGYDEETGEYVAYLRGHLERRRCVRRTGGPTFGGWGATRMALMADTADAPDEDIYTPCYCRSPGSGRRLMFPAIFHRLEARLDVQLATSRDGWNWSRPERRPIISRETEAEPYTSVYASPNLVPLGEEWGLPYLGVYELHDWGGYPRSQPDGEYRWALWKPDRLVALEAPIEGQLTTVERVCQGRALRLNFRTERGGWVKVALVRRPATPPAPVPEISGFELDACDVLEGDDLARTVTWRSRSDLSALKGQAVSVRLRMAKARLFSLAL